MADAKEMLREFEDANLGKDAPRVEGHIERGHGSRHASLDDSKKAEHAALERLVKAEDEVVAATAALAKAQAEHAQALAVVSPAAEPAATAEPEDHEDAVVDE